MIKKTWGAFAGTKRFWEIVRGTCTHARKEGREVDFSGCHRPVLWAAVKCCTDV